MPYRTLKQQRLFRISLTDDCRNNSNSFASSWGAVSWEVLADRLIRMAYADWLYSVIRYSQQDSAWGCHRNCSTLHQTGLKSHMDVPVESRIAILICPRTVSKCVSRFSYMDSIIANGPKPVDYLRWQLFPFQKLKHVAAQSISLTMLKYADASNLLFKHSKNYEATTGLKL